MTWKPDIVIYHGGCDDGFGAAWAVWRKWGYGDAREGFEYDDASNTKIRRGPISYVGMRYGDDLPDVKDKRVLMVDFSLKQEAMREAGKSAHSIVVLDHHKTARAELHEWGSSTPPSNLGTRLAETDFEISHCLMQNCLPIIAWFDMEKSGARLAWEFCWPNEDVPALILAVEDRDLWRFALRDTKEISAALRTYEHSFEQWDAFAADLSSLRSDGAAILRGHQKNIGAFLANAYKAKVGGHFVPVVNVPYHYASDAAHELLQRDPGAPFAAAWFRRGDGTIQWSLRSEDNRVDVSEIAKAFGGGGHRNAAGFQAPAA